MSKTVSSELESATQYELMLALKPSLRETEVKKKIKEFEEIIESGGGVITVNDYWGKRPLAYRMKGNDEALFCVMNFTLPTHFVKELDHSLRIEKELLRYLVIKLPENYTYTKYELVAKTQESNRKESRAPKSSHASVKHTSAPKAEKSDAEVKDRNVEANKKELDDKLGQIIAGEDINL
ncbi:30S ribosomal protein S6 [Candidatus Peregrinibacteria bacterium]|nr:MAG: 30S ribosomal protein S6 [Candidatus Peregrinibacteria bacterium]